MSVLETIKNRRSIRDFKDQPIPGDTVDALIEAVRWAPSAGNLQSRKFYFVFNESVRNRLARTTGNPDIVARVKKLVKNILDRNFVARAPLLVIACLDRGISGRYGERGVNLYGIQDVAASVMNMMLTAYELGVGSVWIGAFNENDVAEIVDLPVNLRPVAMIPLGYPASIPHAPPRITKEEAVEFIK